MVSKCGEQEWKEVWEEIDRIQARRVSSPFRFAEVKLIADKAYFLIENTETSEKNRYLWERIGLERHPLNNYDDGDYREQRGK